MKTISLIIAIYLIPSTAFAREMHYSGEGKVTIPLGKEDPDVTTQASPQYEKEIKAGIITKGMFKEEVIQAIGEPYQKKENYWWYPDRKFIYFKDGKVTEATFPLGVPKGEL